VAPDPEGSSPYLQQPATDPYTEATESTPHPRLISPWSVQITFSHLHISLLSGTPPIKWTNKRWKFSCCHSNLVSCAMGAGCVEMLCLCYNSSHHLQAKVNDLRTSSQRTGLQLNGKFWVLISGSDWSLNEWKCIQKVRTPSSVPLHFPYTTQKYLNKQQSWNF
jgi:hypothetical protein